MPEDYTEPYYFGSAAHVYSVFATSGSAATSDSTTIQWKGILNRPIVSDGSQKVYFRAQQNQILEVNAPTGDATWTSPTLVLDDTPLTSTSFSGALEDSDPYRQGWGTPAWFDPENPPPGFYAQDSSTWRAPAVIKQGGPHDLIPFHVSEDGYYHAELTSGFISDTDPPYYGEFAILRDHPDGVGINFPDSLVDWDVKWMDDFPPGGTAFHSGGGYLEAGVQYYLLYGSWNDADLSDISLAARSYEGQIKGLGGTATYGIVPEPASLMLLGVGALGLLRRRRNIGG